MDDQALWEGFADCSLTSERRAELCDRAQPSRCYSKELLSTVRARSIFVAPDRAALPDVP